MMVPFVVPPGLNTNDTPFVVHYVPSYTSPPPGWIDMDKARFWRGFPQTIGGFETFMATPVTGVCRAIHPWNDVTATLNVAFGTHSHLQVWQGGALFDITPTLALPPVEMDADPINTMSGSATVVVAQAGHPYVVGDPIVLSGATAVGGITPNGTFTVTAANDAGWSFNFGSNATGTATGGGSAIVATPQRAFAPGAINGTGGRGFGTGTYSTGTYSQPSTADFFPRTWALANFGGVLIANPRGGTIYGWTNDTGTPAQPLINAPAQVNFALVTPKRQIVAIGCNEDLSGVYNPMAARACDLEDPTTWREASTNNAWEQVFEGGGRLVAGDNVGDVLFIWGDVCLWEGDYVGDLGQTYRFTRLGQNCGLIGPNAKVVFNQTAYWMSPDGNYWSCALNGEPQLLASAVQSDVFDHLAASQDDKIIASLIPQFGEIWWFYPDARDGNEVSRYVGMSLAAGTWIHGTFDRTAFNAGSPAPYPIGVSASGSAYYHEKGQSADGAPLNWFFESGGQYLGNADQRFQIKSLWPDFQDQVGPVSVSVFTRDYPQGPERLKGPFALAPGKSKRDFLADARIARVRIEGNSAPSFCRMGRPQFDADGSGMQ